MNDIEIIHGIYRFDPFKVPSNLRLPISQKLLHFLARKAFKFFLQYGLLYLEFTYARDPYNHIETVSIVHPLDCFDPLIGEAIVIGRIRRMRGEIRSLMIPYHLIFINLEGGRKMSKPTLLGMYKWTLARKIQGFKAKRDNYLFGSCIFCVESELFGDCFNCKLDKEGKLICKNQYYDNPRTLDYNIQIQYLKKKIKELEIKEEWI